MTSNAEGSFGLWASSQGWVVTKRGWPDFLCRRGSEIMAVEVKDGSDWLRAEQRAALVDLHAAGVPTYIWTPREGLMAYPQKHDKTMAETAALAWELEQARDRITELESALEIARTQLGPAVHKAQQLQDAAYAKLQGAAADLGVMGKYIANLPDVPPEVAQVAKRWSKGGWRVWRMSRVPLDRTA